MRYGIFSDVHSNLEALDAVMEAYKKEAIDRYFCIGDVVGYATNIKECIAKVKALVLVTAAGNHDWASVGLFSLDNFVEHAKEALIWTRRYLDEGEIDFLKSLKLTYQNKDLTLIHGTLHNPQEFYYMTNADDAWQTFSIMKTNICFVGHSHIPGVFIKNIMDDIFYTQSPVITLKDGNFYIVNVGSIGQPRDGNPAASFCIYDTDKKEVYLKRVAYDAIRTRDKIIKAGLPGYLGDRLLIGR